ncbi:MAG: tetratricopeptide repeat protein [Nibricoccus sp.]
MRKFSSFTLVAIVLFFGACKRKEVEVSSVARAQAAHLASEAQLQTKLRDYAQAEKSLAKAVELDPEVAVYWSGLGMNRALLGDKSGAKKAYKRELEICENAAKKDAKNVDLQLAQLRPLVFLGRADEARKLLEKIGRENPSNPGLQQLIATKPIDQILANPAIQGAILK